MFTHKPHNEIPHWLQKIREKITEDDFTEKKTPLCESELSEVWCRIEATLNTQKKISILILWKKIGSYAAGVLLLLGLGLGIYRLGIKDRKMHHLASPKIEIAQVLHESSISKHASKESASQLTDEAEQVTMRKEKVSLPIAEGKGNKRAYNFTPVEENTPQLSEKTEPNEIELTDLAMNLPREFKTEKTESNDSTHESESPLEKVGVITVKEQKKSEGELCYEQKEKGETYDLSRFSFSSQSSVTPFSNPQGTVLYTDNPYKTRKVSLSRGSYLDSENTLSQDESSLLLYNKASFKHQMPLIIGGRVSIPIFTKFSLETGIRYTLLTSKVINYDPTRELIQRIHYLGIPITVNMEIYNYRRLSLYANMGMGIDKVIASRLEKEDLGSRPWQFSLYVGAGVSFSILPQLSIYFNPEFSYYFKNTTSLKTFYQEHPLNFSFSMGVRVNPFVAW